MTMKVAIIEKQEAKPKDSHQLEVFTTYKVVDAPESCKELLNHVVVLLPDDRKENYLFDCTASKILCTPKSILKYQRDYTIRTIQLTYDETDKPK